MNNSLNKNLEEFSNWSKNFGDSMNALDDLGDIVLPMYKLKKIVGNNYTKDLENIASIAQKIMDFTSRYRIDSLLIKADLINLFEQFIEYADSICDFKKLKDYSKDSIFPIIISVLKKSHHFIPVIKSSKRFT